MKLIKVRCYNCRSEEYNHYDSENGFELVKCKNCGLLYVNPRPSDEDITSSSISGMHKGNHPLNQIDRYDESRILFYVIILKDIYKETINWEKTWLDIGCGYGEFMIALKNISQNKIVVKGSEPNQIKKTSARGLGLNVEFIDLDRHNTTYDVVSLLNVFSHLLNPLEFLLNIKNLLKRNGELLLQTGDSAHLSPMHHHKPYYLPDHLSFANEKIIVNILTRVGFDIVKIKKCPYFLPKKVQLIRLAKDILKYIIGRPNELYNYSFVYKFCTRFQSRDMWIRARLVN